MVELPCPLCGDIAAAGADVAAGECRSCAARFAGGAEDPPGAVAAAASAWRVADVDSRLVADGLFRLAPDDPLLSRVGITSDRRDGFYRWWVFLAVGAEAGESFAAAASHGVPRG